MATKKCEVCRKKMVTVRSDAKFCSNRCRLIDFRARQKQKQADEAAALLDRLRVVLPVTAAKVEKFALDHGEDCTGAAVKLVLQAYVEIIDGKT